MERSNGWLSIVFMACLVVISGCGMKQIRTENENLKQEVDQLEQIQRDYSDKLANTRQMSEEEKASLRREMGQMRKSLESNLNQQIQENQALVRKVEDLTVIEIGEAALFGSGLSDLTREGASVIRQLSEVLGQYPGFHIRVEGHTDSLPIGKILKTQFPSNWELSTLRATTVVRYMIYGLEMDPNRLSAVGYAKHRPVADNETEEGRAKNRRIRIVVFKE